MFNVCDVAVCRSDGEPHVSDRPGPQGDLTQDHRLQRPDDFTPVDQSV